MPDLYAVDDEFYAVKVKVTNATNGKTWEMFADVNYSWPHVVTDSESHAETVKALWEARGKSAEVVRVRLEVVG